MTVAGNILQAEDRAHRIGQQNSVNVHYMLGRGTADDHIWKMIESKLSVVSTTLNGQREGMEAVETVSKSSAVGPMDRYTLPAAPRR